MAETGNETRLRIDPQESLPDVLARLRSIPGGPVVLQIPDHCPLLLTATEFRALKDAAEQQHLQLSLDTEDRLRLQLASMFGLAEPAAAPATNGAGPVPRSPGGRSLGGWRAARHRASTETGAATAPPAGAEPADPIAVSRRRRTHLYEPDFAGQARALPGNGEGLNDGSLDYLDEDSRPGLSPRLVGRLVAAGLAVLALLLFGAWFYMPAVSVDLTLRQQPLNTSLIYSVAAPGAVVSNDSAFSVPATRAEAGVDFTVTAKATGVKKRPDKTAAGTVELRNTGKKSVKVPQGTRLTTLAAGSYATLKDVDVPAAKDKKPGEATVQVTASNPGAAGNLAQGYLTGKLGKLGIYYSNRNAAIAGGTDVSIAIVSDKDIKTIEENARTNLNTVTAGAWQKQLPAGTSLVESSVNASNPTMVVTQKAGDQSDTVTLKGTVKATGLTYTQTAVEQQARAAVAKRMGGQVPQGFELDPASIRLGDAQLIAEAPDSTQYSLSATGTARTTFNANQQDALRGRLAGKSIKDARSVIKSEVAIKDAQIEVHPGWWSRRMPQSESRITVRVAASKTSAPGPAPQATPPATPATKP
jgi:hypothetical protein